MKKRNTQHPCIHILMKVSIPILILLLATGVSHAHLTSAQELLSKKVTFIAHNESLKSVLGRLEKSTNVRFTYTTSVLRNQKVSVEVHNESLEQLLKEILEPLRIKYSVSGDFLILERVEKNAARADLQEHPAPPHMLFVVHKIGGKVTDETGEPLPGVSILVKGTQQGTTTDADGAFAIEVPNENTTLVFSFVGYMSQEVEVGGRSSISVALAVDNKALEEVVVVGYGTQRKSDITGAVASIPKERLENVPNINVAQAIQGAIPGVSITQSSGGASGGDFDVMIRGRNSIKANNAPLVVIDGIPGSLSDINPNDVKSIEVLKDASAAAIYGSRGSNGVILITTKEGLREKVKLSYSGFLSTQRMTNLPPIMDGGEFYRFKQVRDPSAITTYETDRYESGDWIYWPDHALRNGLSQQHNLSVSGGFKNTSFYISGGVFNVRGLSVNNENLRINNRINLDTKVNDWISLGSRTQFIFQNQTGGGVNFSGVFSGHPLGEVYDAEGNLTIHPIPYDPQIGNPLESTLYDQKNKTYQIITNNFVDINIPFIQNLKYRFNTGARLTFRDLAIYRGQNTKTGLDARGSSTTERSINNSLVVENILSYDKTFQKHSVSGTALYSLQRDNLSGNTLNATGFPSDLFTYYTVEQAEFIQPNYSFSESAVISQMVRLNYSYDGRYLTTLTARRDGYSGFGTKAKWGLFPSLAVGWNLANEPFFPWNQLFSQLKLRGSFGVNGNQAVSPYETIARLSTTNMTALSQSLPGYLPSKLAQDNLGWESSRTLNLGLDFGIAQNRIQGDFNLFKTITTDLILDRTISPVHGITSITQNIGKTENRGLELSINSSNLRSNRVSWTTMGNLSLVRNRILSLYGQLDENGNETSDIANAWFIGYPIQSNFNFKWAGIWQAEEAELARQYGQQPGFVKVEDLNNDGTVNAADRQIIGQRDPRFLWGLTNTVSYNQFTLSFFIHGVHAVTKENPIMNDHALAEVRHNQTLKDWWTPENPNAGWIANHYNAQLQGGVTVPYFQNASFVRLKDVSLSYNLPQSLLQKTGMSAMNIFVNGRNLVTMTKWTGMDPELSNQRGIPLQKEYVIGLNFSF